MTLFLKSIFVSVSLSVGAIATAQTYHINVIPTAPNGAEIRPLSLNNLGVVAGNYGPSTDGSPFKWSVASGMTAYSKAPNSTETDARIIGDDGNIYGFRRTSGGTVGWKMNNSGIYTDFQDSFTPRAINKFGVLAGNYGQYAATYDPITGLHTRSMPGNGYTEDINDAGISVGLYSANGGSHSLRWDAAGNSTALQVPSGLSFASVLAINNPGMIVGYYHDENNFARPAYWTSDGTVHPISYQAGDTGMVLHINDNGLAVAEYSPTNSGSEGSLWSLQTGFTKLGSLLDASSSGWRFVIPQEINNRGEILAQALAPGASDFNYVLLTPVPEPSSMLALLVPIAFIARRRRR